MDDNIQVHREEKAGPRLVDAQGVLIQKPITTRFPVPEEYDSVKIRKALTKLAGATEPVKLTDAALVPLSPGERGYVLGILTTVEAGRSL